jgi:hypothetical protein
MATGSWDIELRPLDIAVRSRDNEQRSWDIKRFVVNPITRTGKANPLAADIRSAGSNRGVAETRRCKAYGHS